MTTVKPPANQQEVKPKHVDFLCKSIGWVFDDSGLWKNCGKPTGYSRWTDGPSTLTEPAFRPFSDLNHAWLIFNGLLGNNFYQTVSERHLGDFRRKTPDQVAFWISLNCMNAVLDEESNKTTASDPKE